MPGSLDANLRSGNNNESAGLQFLRSIGSVAPVPREQDFGIDAFVTLLQRETYRRLVPNATFAVQLKSKSVTKIELSSSDIKWILNLDMNFFIGHASAGDPEIRLYSIHKFLSSTARFADNVALVLGRDGGRGEIGLGNPVLSWKATDVSTDFLDSSCLHLSHWNSVLDECRLLASLGAFPQYSWAENREPTYNVTASTIPPANEFMPSNPEHVKAGKLLEMSIHRLAVDAHKTKDPQLIELVFDVARKLPLFGIEPSGTIALVGGLHLENLNNAT